MRGPMLQAGGCPIEKQSARENPLARKHHTWKNSLWSAVGKKSVTPPRRAKPYIPEPILPIKPIKCWSWRRDLNPRPSDYKSDALPTELRQQSETTGPRGRIYPSDPFQMSGTILKGTITVICTQPKLISRSSTPSHNQWSRRFGRCRIGYLLHSGRGPSTHIFHPSHRSYAKG